MKKSKTRVLKVINGNKLRKNSNNLSKGIKSIKRNLIDYGEFGLHLPDVDIIIYDPQTYKVIAAISSKVTLRERIAQTGYWKLKLLQIKLQNILKFFSLHLMKMEL